MDWPEFIKNEPIATIGLLITLVLGAFSSPILLEWYAGPNLVAVIRYSAALDGRCVPNRVLVSNKGKSTAANVRIHFQVDYFSKRGDILSYYTGNEALLNIDQNVDYIDKGGYILIPELPPGVSQEFAYIEEQKEVGAFSTRASLINAKDPKVYDYPQIMLITSDRGEAHIETIRTDF